MITITIPIIYLAVFLGGVTVGIICDVILSGIWKEINATRKS